MSNEASLKPKKVQLLKTKLLLDIIIALACVKIQKHVVGCRCVGLDCVSMCFCLAEEKRAGAQRDAGEVTWRGDAPGVEEPGGGGAGGGLRVGDEQQQQPDIRRRGRLAGAGKAEKRGERGGGQRLYMFFLTFTQTQTHTHTPPEQPTHLLLLQSLFHSLFHSHTFI